MASSRYTEEAIEKLNALRAQIDNDTLELVARLSAWRYCLAWLSSFSRVVSKGNGLEDIQLNIAQRNQFAFSYNRSRSEHFGLIVQTPDYFWLRDIKIQSVTILEDGVVLFLSELKTNGFYVAGLAIKIPFAETHREILKEAKLKAKHLWLIRMDNKNGNLTFNEIHRQPIPITDKPYKSVKGKKRSF